MKAVASEDARLKEAIKGEKKKMSKEEIKSMLKSRGIELNPPVVKQDSWEARVSEYTSQYELWKDSPDPKEPWGMVSQTMFQSWELPILEKQRLLREANSAYSLTELELDAVNSRFGEPMSGDLLESILSDLYSEVELDEVDENDGADSEDN